MAMRRVTRRLADRDDHVHLPHREEGRVPLAVLVLARRDRGSVGGPMQTIGSMDGFADVVNG